MAVFNNGCKGQSGGQRPVGQRHEACAWGISSPRNIAHPTWTWKNLWEECRGIGFSFGLNRNEDIEDYSSPKGLVLTLTNIVARGGNLLLGIAPDANGKIPPVMQERLLQMGKWLAVNGEAIYDT